MHDTNRLEMMQVIRKLPTSIFSYVARTVQATAIRQTSSSQPAEFISTNLENGVGRYVCQLQRITFKFCKESPNSRGVREFIENDLIDFARKNPGVVVYLQPKRHRLPKIFAEYLNGSTQTLNLSEHSRDQLVRWLEFMRTRKGDTLVRLLKKQKTHNPSIQGVWTPFTNKSQQLSVESFPSAKLNVPLEAEKTATEKILDLVKESSKTQ